MRNQAVILLLALLGATTTQAADTDRELARQLALQQKNLLPLLNNQEYQSPLPNLLQKASPRLKRQARDANQAAISRQGLDGEVRELMQLRLANPDQADALQQGLSHWLPTYQVVTKRAGAPSRRSTAPAARSISM